MKKNRLLPLALVLCLTLSACGAPAAAPFDPAATAEALLASEAFTDALDTVEQDTACLLYGLDPATVTGCAVYASLSAGAEELAVLALTDEAAAVTALAALKTRVADQTAVLKDYQPTEVVKLDGAIVEQRGNTVLLVVAADAAAAQKIIDAA